MMTAAKDTLEILLTAASKALETSSRTSEDVDLVTVNGNDDCSPLHQPDFEISVTDLAGRGLVATKPIDQNAVIFEEKPLVVGAAISGKTLQQQQWVCIRCSAILSPVALSECTGCGLYCCPKTAKCAVNFHSAAECALLQTMQTKQEVSEFNRKPGWIALVRCALHKSSNDSVIWKAIQQLQSITDEPAYETIKADNIEDVNALRKHLPAIDKLMMTSSNQSMTSPADELVNLCSKLDANCFRQGESKRLLFGVLSMLNHDCSPNARVVFDTSLKARLVAKCDILPGEPITIAYCSPLIGTLERRAHLLKNKLFHCVCPRCQDPTEFGSNISALICPKCNDNVLPKSFTGICSATKWLCPSCPFTTSHDRAMSLLAALKKKISQDEPVKNLEKILLGMKDHRLPPNHHLILELENIISTKYNRVRTLDSLNRRLELLQHRMQVLNVVDRGRSSRLVGFLSYRKHFLLLEKANHLRKMNRVLDPEIGQEISRTLQDSVEILLDDADCPQDLIDTWKYFNLN